MPQIAEILKQIRPELDLRSSNDFVTDGTLDSFDILTLVSELDRGYGIQISGLDILPENFRDVPAIERLLAKYQRP